MGAYYYFTVVAYQCFIEKSHILCMIGMSQLHNTIFYAVLHIYNVLAYKIPPTLLHKDAVIGGMKRLIILEQAA